MEARCGVSPSARMGGRSFLALRTTHYACGIQQPAQACGFSAGMKIIYPSVAFSPDGRTVPLRLVGWHTAPLGGRDRQNLFMFCGHERELRSVAFSPDGQQVLSGSADCTLRLWDKVTGETFVSSGSTNGVECDFQPGWAADPLRFHGWHAASCGMWRAVKPRVFSGHED